MTETRILKHGNYVQQQIKQHMILEHSQYWILKLYQEQMMLLVL